MATPIKIVFSLAVQLACLNPAHSSGANALPTHNQIVADVLRATPPQLDALARRLVFNGAPNQILPRPLLVELRNGNTDARVKIVELLTKLGLILSASPPEIPSSIRDKFILKTLLTDAVAKNDAAASDAEQTLLILGHPEELHSLEHVIVDLLRKKQWGNMLLIAAKAKVREARSLVEAAALQHGDGADAYKFKVLQAALGNTGEEDQFIKALSDHIREAPPAKLMSFYHSDARDASRAAKFIKYLGLIGTDRSLQVVCTYLSSDFAGYFSNQREQSIRLDALRALSHNFPDEAALQKYWKAEHWEDAQDFCRRRLSKNN